jgi:hypothetical protein
VNELEEDNAILFLNHISNEESYVRLMLKFLKLLEKWYHEKIFNIGKERL